MKISLNWLTEYVDLPRSISPQRLAEDLTMSTVEVEGIVNQAKSFDKMVVGKIEKILAHSNADKLKIVNTNIGRKSPVQIVCGGTNLKEGMLVAVALPGASVRWHGEGELVILEKAKIRGEESFGMICSSNEIGISDLFPCPGTQITNLSKVKNIKPGQHLAEALGLDDVIFEIDNKSLTNRPDLWNHYGLARELAAIYKKELKSPDIYAKKIDSKGDLQIKISDKKLCSRYIGCALKNIKIESSPVWMQKRLASVGVRSINNIVDITNYVMLDTGNPVHAFDAQKLKYNILIRPTTEGERIKTLDEATHKLEDGILAITNGEKPVALAGIMGGASTEVSEATTKLVLESATFNATSIRTTAQKLNVRTEASMRFEKSLDPALAELTMRRMLKLILEICPEAEITGYLDVYPVKSATKGRGAKQFDRVNTNKASKNTIKIKHSFLTARIGQDFRKEQVLNILQRLEFTVHEANGIYTIIVPSWRSTGDVSIPEDIVEEVARIFGYDNLKLKSEKVELAAVYQPNYEIEKKIRNYLSLGCGMSEVYNYPWAEEKTLTDLGMSEGLVEIDNPPAENTRHLQPNLIPNLLKNVKDNLRYLDEFKIFEQASVLKSPKDQPKMLAGAVVGKGDVFSEVKGIIEQFPISNFQFPNKDLNLKFLNPDKSVAIMSGKEQIGWLGEMKDKIKNKNVGLFEIDLNKYVGAALELSAQQKYTPLPQYPVIERDLAFEVDWKIKWQDIKSTLENIDKLVYNIEFLSEYDLGNKKSLAFHVTYSADRTLKDAEVEAIEQKIISILAKKFNVKLRS